MNFSFTQIHPLIYKHCFRMPYFSQTIILCCRKTYCVAQVAYQWGELQRNKADGAAGMIKMVFHYAGIKSVRATSRDKTRARKKTKERQRE